MGQILIAFPDVNFLGTEGVDFTHIMKQENYVATQCTMKKMVPMTERSEPIKI